MSEGKNILSPDEGNAGNKRLPEEKLLAYLDGKLSPAEQHDIELWLADEGMESDAIDGLRGQTAEETIHSVNWLNHHLRKKISAKKRTRRQPDTGQFTLIAIAIILLLIVVAYLVIRKAM